VTWLAFKGVCSKTFLWLKSYWQIPFLIAWTIIVYIFARRNSDAIVDVLNAKKESYEKQIKELKSRHQNEIIERDNLIKEYHNTIKRIEKKYSEQEKLLTKKEKERVKEIIKKSKGEPDVIRKEIEKNFGFIYVD
jgi:hypothetical protein